RRAHRAERVPRRQVHEARGAGLGEAVTLEDEDACRVEELGQLAGERSGTGDEETKPVTEALAQAREHETVGHGVAQREPSTWALAALPERRHFASHRERPAEDRGLHRAAL